MRERHVAKEIGIWLVTILLVVLFATQGFAKFSSTHRWAQDFANWGYPIWFRILVGVLELATVPLLLIPRTAGYGASVIGVIMLGGMFTRVLHGESAGVIHEIVPLVFALIVVLTRRPAFVKFRKAHQIGGANERSADPR